MTRTKRYAREEVKATFAGQYGHGLSVSCRNVELARVLANDAKRKNLFDLRNFLLSSLRTIIGDRNLFVISYPNAYVHFAMYIYFMYFIFSIDFLNYIYINEILFRILSRVIDRLK